MRIGPELHIALGDGYGHATRALAYAWTRREQGQEVRIIVGAHCASVGRYAHGLGIAMTCIRAEGARALRDAIAEAAPSLIRVDTFPHGPHGELGPWLSHIAPCIYMPRDYGNPPIEPETAPDYMGVEPYPELHDPPAGAPPFALDRPTMLIVHAGPRWEAGVLLRRARSVVGSHGVESVLVVAPEASHGWGVRCVDYYPARAWWGDKNLASWVTAGGANAARQGPPCRHIIHPLPRKWDDQVERHDRHI